VQMLHTGGALTIPTGTAPVVSSLNIHEPNITATGTVTVACTLCNVAATTEGSSNYAFWVDAGASRFDGNLDFGAGAVLFIAKANTAAALDHTDGTTSLYTIDTRNTVTVQNHVFAQPAAQTLPNGATSRFRLVTVSAPTVTLAGATQISTVNQGATLFLGGPTYNQSGGAVTVDQVSTLHVAVPVAGSSVTITANRMISTGVTDCYLTGAGVWTDTACFSRGKQLIVDASSAVIEKVLGKLKAKTWRYREDIHGDDMGRERVGIVYDELPDELMAPGSKEGVSTGVLSSFALAALKMLWDRNQELEARLARLEAA